MMRYKKCPVAQYQVDETYNSTLESLISRHRAFFYLCHSGAIEVQLCADGAYFYPGGQLYRELSCKKLKSITIPKSITDIGEYAFYDSYLYNGDVYYAGTEAEWTILKNNIRPKNETLLNARIHFGSVGPSSSVPNTITFGKSKYEATYGTEFTVKATVTADPDKFLTDFEDDMFLWSLAEKEPSGSTESYGHFGKTSLVDKGSGVYELSTKVTINKTGTYTIEANYNGVTARNDVVVKPGKVTWKKIIGEYDNGLLSKVDFSWKPLDYIIGNSSGYQIRYCNFNENIDDSSIQIHSYIASEYNSNVKDTSLKNDTISEIAKMKAQIRAFIIQDDNETIFGEWSDISEFTLNQYSLTLTLVANHNNLKDTGHCFLVVANNTGKPVKIGDYILATNETVALGLRAGAPWIENLGGSYINAESARWAIYYDFSYISCQINQEQLDWIFSYLADNSWYYKNISLVLQNCTNMATKIWNHCAPPIKRTTWDNIPYDVKIQILHLAKGGHSGTSLIDCGIIKSAMSDNNVFYISREGKLIPLYINEQFGTHSLNGETTSNEITLTWDPVKPAKNYYTEKSYATGYLVKYKK